MNPSVSTEELADQLTMAGLEVDAIEPVAAEFDSIVVVIGAGHYEGVSRKLGHSSS